MHYSDPLVPHLHHRGERAGIAKTSPQTPELLKVGRRVRWFEEPERALADPIQFLTHVMVFGTVEDLKALRGIVGQDEYREVLEQDPPGIFDIRGLLEFGLRPPPGAPPLPVRAGFPPVHPCKG
jgi:hypothetical protein